MGVTSPGSPPFLPPLRNLLKCQSLTKCSSYFPVWMLRSRQQPPRYELGCDFCEFCDGNLHSTCQVMQRQTKHVFCDPSWFLRKAGFSLPRNKKWLLRFLSHFPWLFHSPSIFFWECMWTSNITLSKVLEIKHVFCWCLALLCFIAIWTSQTCFTMSNCTQHVKFSLHPIGIRFQLPWSTTSIVREHNLASRSTNSVTRGHISDCLRTQFLLSGNSVCAAWIQFRSLGNTITHFSQRHVIGSPAVRCSARVVHQWPTPPNFQKRSTFKHISIENTLLGDQIVFMASWLILKPGAFVIELSLLCSL